MNLIISNFSHGLLIFVNLRIFAYIDPGAGSILFQAIVAVIVGSGVAVKLYWHRLMKFFGVRTKSGAGLKNEPDELRGKS